MDLGLGGKVALITGATRGIGKAIAECFAAEGTNIAFCARDAEAVEQTSAALREFGIDSFAQPADLSDETAIKNLVARTIAHFGRIDIVISNVSALSLTDDEQAWQNMFTIDLLGAVRLFNATLPYLQASGKQHGDAAFTIISSIVAAEPYKPSPYSAMKAALINYAKGAARANAAQKVRCNVVSPGNVYFEGGVWQRMERENPDFYKAWLDKNPSGRMAKAEEIASSVVFLSSPRSAFTTGTNLIVDGCLTQRAIY
jgi:3-oxoacyl-[acyl-carrier protein] reductase